MSSKFLNAAFQQKLLRQKLREFVCSTARQGIAIAWLIMGLLLFAPTATMLAQYKTGQKQPVLPPLPPLQQQQLQSNQNTSPRAAPANPLETLQGVPIAKPILPPPDTLLFSGIRWIVRNTNERSEPGNIYFSGKRSEVFVDNEGRLHLRINYRDGRWYGIDMLADTTLGYGVYALFCETKLDDLPENILFEYSITPNAATDTYIYPILAVQATRLYEKSVSLLRYLVAQAESNETRERKEKVFRPDEPLIMQGLYSTHALSWSPHNVEFSSFHDHGLPTPYLAARWDYAGISSTGVRIPEKSPATALRLRFWSLGAPLGNTSVEVIVKKVIVRSLQ